VPEVQIEGIAAGLHVIVWLPAGTNERAVKRRIVAPPALLFLSQEGLTLFPNVPSAHLDPPRQAT
jgi:hypothetical protein